MVPLFPARSIPLNQARVPVPEVNTSSMALVRRADVVDRTAVCCSGVFSSRTFPSRSRTFV